MSTDILAVAAVAASRGGEGHRAAVSVFVLPAAAPAAKAPAPSPDTAEALQAPTAEDLREVISQIERYLESSRTGLEFRVDRDLNQVIVSVVDPRDGTVLRQMPSEEALRIARAMADEGDGGLLDALV
ncbi:flagellar protein FlaG [Solimonas sp. SE-A11]|uniref:flagellar protein FlaG n=1 Tax=Solimonas sp. SE-A11 TaxID=3054954 RepID=UPI00259C8A89|nr:flagellar protein FlaG [Solimonas sp. SE-A11]MDM4771907.1 flagellar protein FlaG [Solimonas sp. SE-A11]